MRLKIKFWCWQQKNLQYTIEYIRVQKTLHLDQFHVVDCFCDDHFSDRDRIDPFLSLGDLLSNRVNQLLSRDVRHVIDSGSAYALHATDLGYVCDHVILTLILFVHHVTDFYDVYLFLDFCSVFLIRFGLSDVPKVILNSRTKVI